MAKAAGVSVATVGRVIHNNGYVAADKREEIERVIKELGFIPNKLAQGLKKSESKVIGHLTLFNINMLYEQISRAINEKAAERDYHVLTLSSHRNREDEEKLINELLGHRVDGIIITSNGKIKEALVTRLTDLKVPVVMIERTMDLPMVDRIVIDDVKGGYESVQHFIEHGHRDIAFVGCQTGHSVERDRYQGYLNALKDHGIPTNSKWISIREQYSVEEGYLAAATILAEKPYPTAIFATSDTYACGVLQYLYEKDIKVPRDISLIGYDNTLATLMAPQITSMGLPHELIGTEAMRLLLERIEDKELPAREIVVSPVLITRETVKQL